MQRIRIFLLVIGIIFLCGFNYAQEENKSKVLTGFNGGMLLHTGYLFGDFPEINYKAKGVTLGIGGVIRIQLGEHWMIGSEGYVSTLLQLHNGSYIKYGWGGILGEFYWAFPHVMPYVGVTIGGGAQSTFLLINGNSRDWATEEKAIFHKQGFLALTPFIGCDFFLTKTLHLTIKADWMNTFTNKKILQPTGPRFYVGIIFYH